MGSLYFALRSLKEPTRAQLEELNYKFRITSCAEALTLSAMMSQWFWRKLSLSDQCNKYSAGLMMKGDLVDVIWQAIPRLARYSGCKDDIDKILSDYLKNC